MGTQSGRIVTVDALRGIASLSVAWFHFTQSNPTLAPGIAKTSGRYGWLGVDIFFVISGFVIPYALGNARYGYGQFWSFLAKRVVRLDPPYFANICFVLALAYTVPFVPGFRGSWPNFTATQLLSHIAYLNSVIGKPWVNPVYWSLGIEFQYYLLIGFIFPLLSAPRAWVRILTVGGLLIPGFFVSRVSLLFVHLPLFAAGILTYQFKAGRLSKRSFLLALTVTCFIAGFEQEWLIAAVCAITSLTIAFIEFGGRILTWFGMISYSLYLMHVPVGGKIIDLGARLAHGQAAAILVLAAAFAGSIFAAWVLYRAVEMPSQRWSSRISYRRKRESHAEDSASCIAAA